MPNVQDISDNLPLTEPTYMILLSLAHDPRHGYAIMKDVQEISQGRVTLSTGTLYSSLKRLLEVGWIERTADPHGNHDGRGRKAYRLTHLGEQVLQAEVERLRGLLKVAQVRFEEERS